MALYPETVEDDREDDRLLRVDMFGELATLFRDLGCRGDCGTELDRRSVFRVAAFTRSFEEACLRTVCAGALIASVRALRVAFMTSVASMDLSFGDSWSTCICMISWSSAFLARDLAAPAFGLIVAAEFAFVEFFEFGIMLDFGMLGFGSKSSPSEMTVAGVHVDVDVMLSRTESAMACREAMMIQKAYRSVTED